MKEVELLSVVSQIKLAGASRTVRSIKCRREAALVQASFLMLVSVSNLAKLVARSLRVKQLSIHSIQTVATKKYKVIIRKITLRPSILTVQM
jgi:hypothetical protein